jgi:alpha-D-xyloside xylohydrolase
MLLEFPGDPACEKLDLQYMLGDSLLVAPVFTPDGTVIFYLPPGRWTGLLDGEVLGGARWVHSTCDFLSLPLLARPGSLIPMGQVDDRPDYDYADGVTFHLFELAESGVAVADVPTQQGAEDLRLTVRRNEGSLFIEPEGARKDWSLVVHGRHDVPEVENGRGEPTREGIRLFPNEPRRSLTVGPV